VFSKNKDDYPKNSGENRIIALGNKLLQRRSKSENDVEICEESQSDNRSSSMNVSVIDLDQSGVINTTASYIFKSDGTMRECPVSVKFPNNPKVLVDKSIEVRLVWEIDIVLFAAIPEVGDLPLLVIVHHIIMQTSLNKHLKLDMDRVNN